MAFRTSRSMQVRNAASVFPEPVGAEISVVLLARICGQPCSCGSVAAPNRPENHSWTTGWAQLRACQIHGHTMTLYKLARNGRPGDKNNIIHLGAKDSVWRGKRENHFVQEPSQWTTKVCKTL